MTDELQELEAEVGACLGLPAVEMRVAPAGGAGHVAYEVRDPAGSDEPVAFYRCESGFAGRRYGLRREAEVLPVAAALGWPVPQVLGTPGDPPGLLMNLVPGTSRPDPDETEATAPEYLALVAGVHAADPAAFPIEQFATTSDALRDELAWWTAYADECGVLEEPLLRLAARVLAATLPDSDEAPSLVHGDVGAGNFMVEHGTVTAMIDWELAHVGDPHEDMAWLWMRGAHTSFGDPRQRVAEYEAVAGRTIDPDRLRWHLALVMWKSCVGMYADLRRPPTPAALVQSMVILTYDALLGAQLLRLLGGSLQLLEQTPVRRVTPATQPAERMLATTELSKESSITVGYLRECSAQEEWQREAFDHDLRSRGLPARGELPAHIDRVDDRALLDVATVLAHAADRAAMTLPNAMRRIERAQHIHLGTTTEPLRGDPERAD
ncbi:MAG TPA: phosphotransferase family protein [Acidimicrobiia bacterium]|nr:phosphotransferase family protein [Acidimicrobiia bacterium]